MLDRVMYINELAFTLAECIKTDNMIDTERRKKLAYHLRHLSIGLITNDEYEDYITNDVSFGWLPEQYYRAKEVEFDDAIIKPMLELSWLLYSDLKEHKLIGKYKLTEKQIKDITRYILFLHSENEYEWNYFDLTNPFFRFSFKDIILSVITLGKHYQKQLNEREKEYAELQKNVDYEYWPFINRKQYEKELNNQPFLKEKANG
jgi:hypothetical protein